MIAGSVPPASFAYQATLYPSNAPRATTAPWYVQTGTISISLGFNPNYEETW